MILLDFVLFQQIIKHFEWLNKNEPYFDLINDIMIKQVGARVKFIQGKSKFKDKMW